MKALSLSRHVKKRLKKLIPQSLLALRYIVVNSRPLHERTCPICGYHGLFDPYGHPPRMDAKCHSCGSLERHRLFWLWFIADRSKVAEPVLHFAAEPILRAKFRGIFSDYKTADLFEGADLNLDIENIALGDGTVGTLICNHVLEHVRDSKALSEIRRVLAEDGLFVCSVPIVEGWETSYEDPAIIHPRDRAEHFGQSNHVRYYGRDFRQRLRAAGFSIVSEVTAEGKPSVDYGLIRGGKIFVCRKDNGAN